jgi:hypothetical protein
MANNRIFYSKDVTLMLMFVRSGGVFVYTVDIKYTGTVYIQYINGAHLR